MQKLAIDLCDAVDDKFTYPAVRVYDSKLCRFNVSCHNQLKPLVLVFMIVPTHVNFISMVNHVGHNNEQ